MRTAISAAEISIALATFIVIQEATVKVLDITILETGPTDFISSNFNGTTATSVVTTATLKKQYF